MSRDKSRLGPWPKTPGVVVHFTIRLSDTRLHYTRPISGRGTYRYDWCMLLATKKIPVRLWIVLGVAIWLFLAARGIGIFPLLLSGKVVQVDGGGEPVTGIAGVTVSVSDEHTGELVGETVTGADGGYWVFVGPFPVAIVDVEVDESTVPPNLEYRVSDHERHGVVVGPLGGSVYLRFREVLSTISFVVFDDSDADGAWDADEGDAGPGVLRSSSKTRRAELTLSTPMKAGCGPRTSPPPVFIR